MKPTRHYIINIYIMICHVIFFSDQGAILHHYQEKTQYHDSITKVELLVLTQKNKFVEIITQTANNYDLTHLCIGITISAAGTTLLKITIATVTMMSCHFH